MGRQKKRQAEKSVEKDASIDKIENPFLRPTAFTPKPIEDFLHDIETVSIKPVLTFKLSTE